MTINKGYSNNTLKQKEMFAKTAQINTYNYKKYFSLLSRSYKVFRVQIWHTPFVSQALPKKESIQALTQLDGSLDPQNSKAAPRNEKVPMFELAIKLMVSNTLYKYNIDKIIKLPCLSKL